MHYDDHTNHQSARHYIRGEARGLISDLERSGYPVTAIAIELIRQAWDRCHQRLPLNRSLRFSENMEMFFKDDVLKRKIELKRAASEKRKYRIN